MRRLAIGTATVGLVAAGVFGTPPAQAVPEGCASVYPVPCEYVASTSGGCALIGSIKIEIFASSGTITKNYTSATPDTPCTGIGSDTEQQRVVVTPLTPGTATFVGSDGGLPI